MCVCVCVCVFECECVCMYGVDSHSHPSLEAEKAPTVHVRPTLPDFDEPKHGMDIPGFDLNVCVPC